MKDSIAEPRRSYGGSWTIEKLDILEKYLDAYTTALKGQPFKLAYIDAFAGTGYVELDEKDQDASSFIRGSAKRALDIKNKPFDKLIFVEKDPDRCTELENLRKEHHGRDIQIENSEANRFLKELQPNWNNWRGVLFLDPFATEVEWSTIEAIAGFNALDTWILFPVSAISRMLPTSKQPEEIDPKWAARLTKVYGDQSWRGLYRRSGQLDFFGQIYHLRTRGVKRLVSIYKENLKALFGDRFLDQSRTLKNSRNSPLFEFLFCVGNPNGIGPAKRIAKHILKHI